MERNGEGDQNADVAPLVGVEVLVLGVDVRVAIDGGTAGNSTHRRTYSVGECDVFITRESGAGYKSIALVVAVVELVDHELRSKVSFVVV